MSLAALAAFSVSAFAQPAFDPPPLPPGCTGAANQPCALLDFTRRSLAPALTGVTLAPAQGQPRLFLATTTDKALPAFRMMWLEDQPMTAERAASTFINGVSQPGRNCITDLYGRPTAIGQSFAMRCTGGQSPAIQIFFHAVPGRQRLTALVFLAPLENGPALLARGDRAAIALAQAMTPRPAPPPPLAQTRPGYSPPANFAQLRADCADEADIARQIAGCNAVLANPAETNNYAIATNNRGHARERSGDLAAALRDYDQAVALEPGYVRSHVSRGRVLTALGRIDEAIAALDRSIAIEDDGWTRLERGQLHATRRDFTPALADLDAAVRLLPGEAGAVSERNRVRAAQAAAAAPAPMVAGNALEALAAGLPRGYVGEALLRAPLGPLPAGDALAAYTRELLAPGFAGLTVSPLSASNAAAFRGEAPGLPSLTLRWWDQPDISAAEIQMRNFERELNGSCINNGILAQRGGDGARVMVFTATCSTISPPYQLWWLTAWDRERSRLLLVAAPSAQGPALLAGGERVLAALGMSSAAGAASPPAAPTSPRAPPQAGVPPPAPREVQTVRGLMRDKPFSVSFPAGLDQGNDANLDLVLQDAQQELEFNLTIRAATPSQSAEFDARVFGDGVEYVRMLQPRIPGATLVGHALMSLPGGPAHVVHVLAPASGAVEALRLISLNLYDSGRQYRLLFAVQESALERRREAIGFILANFSTSNTQRPCCTDPVAFP